MQRIWSNIPVIIKALILGFLMLFPVVLINQSIIINNVSSFSEFPWAFVLVLLVLWLYWQLATGKEHPFGRSEYRKLLSMTSVPYKYQGWPSIFIMSLALLVLIFSVNSIGFALYGTEETVQFEFIKLIGTAPRTTAIFLLLGLALTAGIAEEIVFRGYIQTLLLDRYGIAVSFIIVGVIFTLIHFLPKELLLPYFIVSIGFSWVTYQTQSVIPGIIVHVLFDFIAFMAVYFDLDVSRQTYMMDTIERNVIMVVVSVGLMVYLGRRSSRGKGIGF